MLTYLIFLTVGVIIGITSSLFGFGGGFLVVPALFWLLPHAHVPTHLVMHVAVATSLTIMMLNSINSTWTHTRRGHINWAIFFSIAPAIAIGSILGAFLSIWISGNTLRYSFICFLSAIIIRNLLNLNKEFKTVSPAEIKLPPAYLLKTMGLGIGAIATLLGVGGSVLTVPLLRRSKMRMINAVALAAPLSLPVALFGATCYYIIGLHIAGLSNGFAGLIYLPAFFGIGLGGFIGVPLGARIGHHLPDRFYARIYILLQILVILFMLKHQH
ncbi:MAG: sulfite exporter TauE/SafE family protein [Pseudomonadota bacterium]|nr:sulfite exporter TauE/SafE family protein [Pseudomonadota bacterium]